MFHFQLSPEFKLGAARLAQPLAPYADRISKTVLAGARNVMIGGVAGWGAVVVAGAVLMANASPDKCCAVTPPPPPAVASAPLAAPAAPVKADPAPVEPAKPAPPATTAKSTQRVDMTPTAAIPVDPASKPKHKPHKKKPADSHT